MQPVQLAASEVAETAQEDIHHLPPSMRLMSRKILIAARMKVMTTNISQSRNAFAFFILKAGRMTRYVIIWSKAKGFPMLHGTGLISRKI
eukprot:3945448-Karenia_brevis.AAC.1